MSSLVPGYQYDIFISYRQNDNRSGWVTEFVKSLQEELAATIKDPVSIYFDYNSHDGLLENHDVDDSLKIKLGSAILIPVISQTYCDVRSFAWKHEFVEFKRMASEDPFGLKIKLPSGNVASRILPVCIHDLDAADKKLLEEELGGPLRGIEFIFRGTGVVRPLNAVEEDSKANLNHTYHRDQINKVARAIKELLNGFNSTTPSLPEVLPANRGERTLFVSRKKLALAAAVIGMLGLLSFTYYYFGGFGNRIGKTLDKSIAVLPFENMNKDPEQDYFSNGIADDILNHLTKVADLKVKSRTSTLQYKGTQKSMKEIGDELGVANIVEGSVRRVEGKVRIVVQLIDAKTDLHLWSETYDRELKDVLALQSEIAIKIANALEARLTNAERKNIQKEVSQNITAYDYFLKAREIFNTSNLERIDYENALLLLNHAIRLDPDYSRAYALKGSAWFDLGYFGISEKIWQDSALYLAAKAIAIDPNSPDGYVVRGWVHHYIGKIEESKEDFGNAYKVAPNDPAVLLSYGNKLLRDRNEKGAELILKSIETRFSLHDAEYYLWWEDMYAITGNVASQEKLLQQAKNLSPGYIFTYIALSQFYLQTGQYAKGIAELKQAEKLNPAHQFIADQLGWHSYLSGDLENAAFHWSKYKEIESRFDDSTQVVSFRHRLAMTYLAMGRKKEAETLFTEDLMIHKGLLSKQRSMGAWANFGSIYYGLAVDYASLGNLPKAVQCLDSSLYYQFNYPWGFRNDPLFSVLRNRDDFKKVFKKFNDYEEFRQLAFSNAINRMEANHELKNVLK